MVDVQLKRMRRLNPQGEYEQQFVQPAEDEEEDTNGSAARKVRRVLALTKDASLVSTVPHRLSSLNSVEHNQRQTTSGLLLTLRRCLLAQREHAVQALQSVVTVARVLVDLCPSGCARRTPHKPQSTAARPDSSTPRRAPCSRPPPPTAHFPTRSPRPPAPHPEPANPPRSSTDVALSLQDLVVLLHNDLLFAGGVPEALQDAVCRLCEAWWCAAPAHRPEAKLPGGPAGPV